MARFIAIGKAPGWNDLERFTAELKSTDKWRIDARTTITTVYALEDGRLIAECTRRQGRVRSLAKEERLDGGKPDTDEGHRQGWRYLEVLTI